MGVAFSPVDAPDPEAVCSLEADGVPLPARALAQADLANAEGVTEAVDREVACRPPPGRSSEGLRIAGRQFENNPRGLELAQL